MVPVTVEQYQVEMIARLDAGLWAVVAVAAIALFALGILVVKAVW